MTLSFDELRGVVGTTEWLDDAIAELRRQPERIAVRFPEVGRKLGRRDEVVDGWSVEDAGRALLLSALGDAVRLHLDGLYRHGDAREKRAVLRALPMLPVDDAGLPYVRDAIRSNDAGLVAAALGPYGISRLPVEELEQAITKCVFMQIPLSVTEIAQRVTPRMSDMLASLVLERVTAGRDVQADVWPVIDAHPPAETLEAITAMLDSPVPERARAARTVLQRRALSKEAQ